MKKPVCYFCGGVATTKEHVPPKGFFPRTDRGSLITVPSCPIHNTDKSGDDEYFRMLISGLAWPDLPEELKMTILRSVKRKPLLGKKLLRQCVNNFNGFFHYDSEHERLYSSLEAVGRGIIFHEHELVKTSMSMIIPNFTQLPDSATDAMRREYLFSQVLSHEILFEKESKGTHKEIFQYKCTKRYVRFTFFQKFSTTIGFDD